MSFDITPNLKSGQNQHNGVYQYSFFATDNDSIGTVIGLGLYSKAWGKLEAEDSSDNKYSPSSDDTINHQCLNVNGTKKPLTITFIAGVDQNGDYQRGTFSVTSKDGEKTYLTANMDSTIANTALISGSATFRTFSDDSSCNAIYTIGNVSVSKLNDNIVKSVPEPTTATLSLLALAGLALVVGLLADTPRQAVSNTTYIRFIQGLLLVTGLRALLQ